MKHLKEAVKIANLYKKIEEWERMADLNNNRVATYRTSGAPPTPSQHFASLMNEIIRLKQALGEACYYIKLYEKENIADRDRKY